MDAKIGENSTGFTSLPINTDLFLKKQGVNHNTCQSVSLIKPLKIYIQSVLLLGDVEQKEQGENHLSCGNAIVISNSVITYAYNEIATWRKNVFLVPYGKVGRDLLIK